MRDKSSLRIVIVNWNSGDQLGECLRSIGQAAQVNCVLEKVVIVDNKSEDASLEFLQTCNLGYELICNSSNRGFAAACNQGALASQVDYLLFLNPDTRIGATSLDVPVAFMDDPANEKVGICGIQLWNANDRVSRSCSRFPSLRMFIGKSFGLNYLFPGIFPDQLMTEWDHRQSAPVDQVIGAFFLVRRSIFEALGGFDERFFVYYEEVDFALRAMGTGWSSYFLAEAQAYHRGQGTTEKVKSHRLFCSLRSRILYARKHFKKPAATILILNSLLWEPVARILVAMARLSPVAIMETIQGYLELWKYFITASLKGSRVSSKGITDNQ